MPQKKEKGWELSIKREGARTKAASVVLTESQMEEVGMFLDDRCCTTSDELREFLSNTGALPLREFTVSFVCTVDARNDDHAQEIGDNISTAGEKLAGVSQLHVDTVDEW